MFKFSLRRDKTGEFVSCFFTICVPFVFCVRTFVFQLIQDRSVYIHIRILPTPSEVTVMIPLRKSSLEVRLLQFHSVGIKAVRDWHRETIGGVQRLLTLVAWIAGWTVQSCTCCIIALRCIDLWSCSWSYWILRNKLLLRWSTLMWGKQSRHFFYVRFTSLNLCFSFGGSRPTFGL